MKFEMNQFYNMDCMEGMKEFPDKYFELAIVDPPYFEKAGDPAYYRSRSCQSKARRTGKMFTDFKSR